MNHIDENGGGPGVRPAPPREKTLNLVVARHSTPRESTKKLLELKPFALTSADSGTLQTDAGEPFKNSNATTPAYI